MSIVIRAHYDGKVIIPDEPVNLPANKPLNLHFDVIDASNDSASIKKAAFNTLLSRRISGLNIPDEAIGRESIYEDRL